MTRQSALCGPPRGHQKRPSLNLAAAVVSCRVTHSVSQVDNATLKVRRGCAGALTRLSYAVLPRPLEALRVFDTTNCASIATKVAQCLAVGGVGGHKRRRERTG